MSARGHYHTRQRQAVLRALARHPGFVSVQTLHARMRQAGEPVALSTIYRAVHAYADTGVVTVAIDEDGTHLFLLAPGAWGSHYLVCRTCGNCVPIDGRPVEDWAAAIAAEHGFTDAHLVLELAGRCRPCAAGK